VKWFKAKALSSNPSAEKMIDLPIARGFLKQTPLDLNGNSESPGCWATLQMVNLPASIIERVNSLK
jgi:hypothetical protein